MQNGTKTKIWKKRPCEEKGWEREKQRIKLHKWKWKMKNFISAFCCQSRLCCELLFLLHSHFSNSLCLHCPTPLGFISLLHYYTVFDARATKISLGLNNNNYNMLSIKIASVLWVYECVCVCFGEVQSVIHKYIFTLEIPEMNPCFTGFIAFNPAVRAISLQTAIHISPSTFRPCIATCHLYVAIYFWVWRWVFINFTMPKVNEINLQVSSSN